MTVTGLQGHIDGCPPGSLTGILKGIDLGMRHTCPGMKAAAHNPAVINNHGPHGRIGSGAPQTFAGLYQGLLHEADI